MNSKGRPRKLNNKEIEDAIVEAKSSRFSLKKLLDNYNISRATYYRRVYPYIWEDYNNDCPSVRIDP